MKTSEEMARDVLRRRDAYEAKMRARRQGAARAGVCAVACVAIGAGAWRLQAGGRLAAVPGETAETGRTTAPEETAAKETERTEHPGETAASGETAAPGETAETERTSAPEETAPEETERTEHPGETAAPVETAASGETGNSGENSPSGETGAVGGLAWMTGTPDPNAGLEYRTVISGYGDNGAGSAACYALPGEGKAGMSVPLRDAMEEYGDTVMYRVVVDVFDWSGGEGEILDPGSREVQAEAEALGDQGYTVVRETYFDGEAYHHSLCLIASLDDLESLTPGQGRAYFLRLYQESFPETETTGPAFAGPAVEADGTSLTQ